MSAALIRSEVHTADENEADVTALVAGDEEGTEKRSVQNCNCDGLNFFIMSFIYNLEKVKKVPYVLQAVDVAPKRTLQDSTRVNAFETIYSVFTAILCVGSAVLKDPFVSRWGVNISKNEVYVSLANDRHRFAARSELRASRTPYFSKKSVWRCFLCIDRTKKWCLKKNLFSSAAPARTPWSQYCKNSSC